MRRVTVIAVLLLAAACSSSSPRQAASTTTTTSESTTSTTATTAPTTTATTAPPVPDLGAVNVRLTQVGTYDQPLDLKWCANHPDPLVAEKTGKVRDTRTGATLLDLTGDVSSFGEQGLLGIACAPDGGTLYVDYTSRDGKQDRVDAYSLPPPGTPVDKGTRRNVLTVADPAPNHNGGYLVIGPDGRLWCGLGDGGGENDQFHNGQNPNTILSKIVRIDLAIGKADVAVAGVRNPWRFSFDRATGDLWIGDVGQDHIEEVDQLPAGHILGANLGWPLYEGNAHFQQGADPPGLVLPVFQYTHAEGQAVTGGYVYRGKAVPALRGAYLFADGYKATLRAIVVQGGKTVQQRVLGVKVPGSVLASFAEDPNGELYALSLGGGIFRIDAA